MRIGHYFKASTTYLSEQEDPSHLRRGIAMIIRVINGLAFMAIPAILSYEIYKGKSSFRYRVGVVAGGLGLIWLGNICMEALVGPVALDREVVAKVARSISNERHPFIPRTYPKDSFRSVANCPHLSPEVRQATVQTALVFEIFSYMDDPFAYKDFKWTEYLLEEAAEDFDLKRRVRHLFTQNPPDKGLAVIRTVADLDRFLEQHTPKPLILTLR